jgi:hypothetical protein
MFDDDTIHFLRSGCALLVAVITDDGAPYATRGWGLDLLDDERVRVLVDADDPITLAGLQDGARVAITGSSVRTLRSLQLKGRVLTSAPEQPQDRARMVRFCDDFWGDVEDIHGTPRYLLDRLAPCRIVSFEAVVDEVYNQTPGPSAGQAMGDRAGDD